MSEPTESDRPSSADVVGMYRRSLSDVVECVRAWQVAARPLTVPSPAAPVGPLFAGMLDCLLSVEDLVDKRPVPALIMARSLFEKAVRIGRYAATSDSRCWELLSGDLRVQALGQQVNWSRERRDGARKMRDGDHGVSDSDVNACEADLARARNELEEEKIAYHQLASAGGCPDEARWKDLAQMARAQNPHLHLTYMRATAAAHGSLLANQGRVVTRANGELALRVAGVDPDHALLACHLSAGGFILGEAKLSQLCSVDEVVTGLSTLRPLVSGLGAERE